MFKALTALAESSGVNLFKTAGLLYIIGAVTTVIAVGFFLILAAWIVYIIAYFTINPEMTATG